MNPTGSDLGAAFGGVGGHRWRLINRLIEIFWSNTDLQRAADESARIISEEIGDGATVILLDEVFSGEAVYAISTSPERQQVAEQMFSRLSMDDLHRLVRAFDERPARTVNTIAAVLPDGPTSEVLLSYSEHTELRDVALCPIPGRHGLPRGVIICSRNRESERFASEDLAALVSAADSIGMGVAMGLSRMLEEHATHRWQRAFEISPFGYAIFDMEQRVVAINPAGCEIFGRSLDDAVGLPWSEIGHPADREPDLAEVGELIREEVPYIMGVRRVRQPDGTERWIHRSLTVIRDTLGAPAEFHLQFMDITEQRLAEAQAELFRALVESSPDFVGVANLDGSVSYINAAGRAMVGLPEDFDVTTTRIAQYGKPVPEPTWIPEGTWAGDDDLRDWRDDTYIRCAAVSFVVKDIHSGKPTGIATVQHDIRDRLAAEQVISDLAEQRRVLLAELVSAEQAERSRIAGDVHDDALQLLAAGQLRLHLLLEQLDRADVGAARQAAEDVADLIGDSQRQLRRLLLDLEPPIGSTRQLQDALRATAESFFADTATTVTITGTLSELPPDVAAVFYRAGREAVSNARRHARADHVLVRLAEDDTCWTMTVLDDGVGVPDSIPYRPGHLGVRGMSNRAAALGGSFTIGRQQEGGTRVVLSVPRPHSAG